MKISGILAGFLAFSAELVAGSNRSNVKSCLAEMKSVFEVSSFGEAFKIKRRLCAYENGFFDDCEDHRKPQAKKLCNDKKDEVKSEWEAIQGVEDGVCKAMIPEGCKKRGGKRPASSKKKTAAIKVADVKQHVADKKHDWGKKTGKKGFKGYKG